MRNDEPVRRLFTQGMVIKDGAKMSKNKGNVVSADDMIDRFGADTGRVFELFAAPPEKDLEWTDAGAEGCYRFLGRVFRFITRNLDGSPRTEPTAADRKLQRKLHQTIRKVTDDFETRWHFNTSIAGVMELVNEAYSLESELSSPVLADFIEKLTLMLGPFAPYMTQEIWEMMGRDGLVFRQPWPEADEELAKEEGAEVILQVNGKLRSKAMVPFGTPKEELERIAKADEKIQPHIAGKTIAKIIVVPDKLVNIVVKG
jgi:leucyl-tRNA synthetase